MFLGKSLEFKYGHFKRASNNSNGFTLEVQNINLQIILQPFFQQKTHVS